MTRLAAALESKGPPQNVASEPDSKAKPLQTIAWVRGAACLWIGLARSGPRIPPNTIVVLESLRTGEKEVCFSTYDPVHGHVLDPEPLHFKCIELIQRRKSCNIDAETVDLVSLETIASAIASIRKALAFAPHPGPDPRRTIASDGSGILWHLVEGIIPSGSIIEGCRKQFFFHGTYDDAAAFAYCMGRRYTVNNRPLRVENNRVVVQPTVFLVQPVPPTDSALCAHYETVTNDLDKESVRLWWSIGPSVLGFFGTEAEATRLYYRVLALYLLGGPDVHEGGCAFGPAIAELIGRYESGKQLLDTTTLGTKGVADAATKKT